MTVPPTTLVGAPSWASLSKPSSFRQSSTPKQATGTSTATPSATTTAPTNSPPRHAASRPKWSQATTSARSSQPNASSPAASYSDPSVHSVEHSSRRTAPEYTSCLSATAKTLDGSNQACANYPK